jgi:hypothetical protein
MSGGVSQLVAIGAQDAWLTGKPEVSFFRANYKRHTNFSHVVSRQVLQGAVNPGGMSSIRFERKGDMLSYVYLTKMDPTTGRQVVFTENDIDHIDFLIGGQVIDSQNDHFINYVADPYLSTTENRAQFSQTEVGHTGYFYPLRFWFCDNWQSALPLISLQYHDVEVRVYWNSSIATSPTPIFQAWADFIVLDTQEREDFATRPQNHLIYQVQRIHPSNTKIQNLVLNHPVKFISTGFTGNCLIGTSTATVAALGATNYIDTVLFQVNGVDVGEPKTYTPHFDMVPNYYSCPVKTPDANNGAGGSSVPGQAFLLPFCLDTTKLQPTGSLNFSRLDSARLVSSNTFVHSLYAVNYNILKIENGMGGMMYAN